MIEIESTPIEGAFLIKRKLFEDERGAFKEICRLTDFKHFGSTFSPIQFNHSFSTQSVVRGLHFTKRKPQTQLVTVASGEIYDVIVDLRQTSKTYKQYFGAYLDSTDTCQLLMPAGVAHGFCVMSSTAHLFYAVDQYYDPSDDTGILWNDPDLNINWPVKNPILSRKDSLHPTFKQFSEQL